MRHLTLSLALVAALAATPAWAAEPLTVEKQMLDDLKAVYATVESVHIQHARARIGGTLAGLTVREGDEVEEGEILAVVGDPKLVLELESVAARIQSLQAQRSQAGTELRRAEQLFSQGVIPRARLDEARTAVQVLDQTIAALRSERQVVEQREAEGAVLAPGAGRVLDVLMTNGTVAMPGEAVVTVASGGQVLRMELPERHARFIAEGDVVWIGPRGLEVAEQAARTEGRVSLVYPALRNGRVVADVAVEGLEDAYFVGERALVYIATGQREAFVLPEDYLTVRHGVTYATLQGGMPVVVQTGARVAGGVEILSGLRVGDVVVTP